MTKAQFDELFRLHENYLLTVILGRLYEGCPSDFACDILQDVFTTALEKRTDEKFNHNPGGWLVVTARNKVDNFNRKETNRMRFHESAYDFDLDDLTAITNMFEDLALKMAIEDGIMDKILNELKPDDRVLLIMRYFQNNSLDDIAADLGIPKNRLNVKINRMKAQVKKIIHKYVSADET